MVASLHTRTSHIEPGMDFAGWAALMMSGAALAAALSWSHHRSPVEDEDAPPVAPTMSMQAWIGESQSSITTLVNARNEIAAAASRRDIPATGVACQAATAAVSNLRVHMPSPEAAVNQSLQQAISSYAAGLPVCADASAAVDGEGMQRAAGWISLGDTAMQAALDILGDETGQSGGRMGMLIV